MSKGGITRKEGTALVATAMSVLAPKINKSLEAIAIVLGSSAKGVRWTLLVDTESVTTAIGNVEERGDMLKFVQEMAEYINKDDENEVRQRKVIEVPSLGGTGGRQN